MTSIDLVGALAERARQVIAHSESLAARSLVLVDASRYARREEMSVPRCAWCARVALGGVWLHHEQVPSFVMAAISHRSTDGICPSCFAEQLSGSAETVLVHAGDKETADRLVEDLDGYEVAQRSDHVLTVHVEPHDHGFVPHLLTRLADCVDAHALAPIQVRIGSHAYSLEGR